LYFDVLELTPLFNLSFDPNTKIKDLIPKTNKIFASTVFRGLDLLKDRWNP